MSITTPRETSRDFETSRLCDFDPYAWGRTTGIFGASVCLITLIAV